MMLSKLMDKKAKVPPVSKEKEPSELNIGMQHEAAEHSWLSPAQVRRLTMDHLKENEEYYSELAEMEAEEKEEPEDEEKD
jgi:hypothetical protein